ncbi:phage portal protein [Paenibacillus kandeliae]|uniref:phage portal protein n=1 Tax=Paenibacillus kandeliae TaxID=3231269 RepID=UPI003458C3FE
MSDVQWIDINKAAVPSSTQISDVFDNRYDVNGLVPFELGTDPGSCRLLVKNSNIIPQCIEAYRRNITGYGVTLEYTDGESDQTAKEEWNKAERFLETCSLDPGIESLIGSFIEDLETYGMTNVEVAWATGSEFPTLYRMSPNYIRYTRENTKATVRRKVMIKSTKQIEEFTQEVYVRKYAMSRSNEIVWFRLFGTEGDGNQIIPLRLGQDGTYGEPRWFGHAPGILGSREAEELNVNYFSNGRMLSMLLTVINGELTPESIEALKTIKGSSSQSGILYLKAKGQKTGGPIDEKIEKVEIKVDKLNDLLQEDALFLEYGKEKKADILSAFRLPPILVGMSSDYNRATAESALQFAEEQIFQPYRKWIMDEIFNKRIFPALGIFRVQAVLRGAKIVDPDERRQLLDFIAVNGIMLVRHLIPIAEDVLGTTIDEAKYSEEYLDTPIAYLLNKQPEVIPVGTTAAGDTDDLQNKVVSIAKRLLKHGADQVDNHV